MSLIIPANTLASGGYAVDNSCRFNGASSDDLERTPSSSGNNTTNTLSFWVKRSTDDGEDFLVYGDNGSANRCKITFLPNGKLQINTIVSASNNLVYETNRLFRDLSAWYHIVIAFNSTLGTAGDRCRLYVNGVEETSFATETDMGSSTSNFLSTASATVYIGSQGTGNYYDGYMAEFVFIDGQQLAPTDFGEFDEDSGIWKPIDVSGLTFGTNGFYLDFENSGALGNDAAGSNNFTVNNLTAIDQSTDTCTNNFATGNSLVVGAPGTYSEGNLKITNGSNNWQTFWSSIAVSQGKWWVEVKCTSGNFVLGISETTSNELYASGPEHFIGGFTAEIGYYQDGRKFVENSASSYGASFADGDFIGMALDLDSGTRTINFYKNGSAQGNITLPSSMETMTFGIANSAGNAELNFGSPSFSISSGNADGNGYGNFEYAVPSGHLSLNTKNLSEALS